jgi:hypothetical protein
LSKIVVLDRTDLRHVSAIRKLEECLVIVRTTDLTRTGFQFKIKELTAENFTEKIVRPCKDLGVLESAQAYISPVKSTTVYIEPISANPQDTARTLMLSVLYKVCNSSQKRAPKKKVWLSFRRTLDTLAAPQVVIDVRNFIDRNLVRGFADLPKWLNDRIEEIECPPKIRAAGLYDTLTWFDSIE